MKKVETSLKNYPLSIKKSLKHSSVMFSKMRILALLCLLWLMAEPLLTPNALAQQNNPLECKITLLNARRRIGVKVIKSEAKRHNYTTFPTGRSQNYLFILANGDQGSNKVMNNTALLSSITSEITSACKQIGFVNFSIDQTDLASSFGLVGGRITQFKCLNFDPDKRVYIDEKGKTYPKLPWGYESCP